MHLQSIMYIKGLFAVDGSVSKGGNFVLDTIMDWKPVKSTRVNRRVEDAVSVFGCKTMSLKFSECAEGSAG